MSRADFGRLVALAGLWGLAFVFIRVAVPPLGPVTLTAIRVLIAGLVLAAYARHAGVALRVRDHRGVYLAVGFFNSAAPFVLIALAQTVLSASWTVVLVATTPLQTAVAAALVLGERFTVRKAAGLLLGIAGVAMLVGWQTPEAAAPPFWAVACALAAGGMYSVAAVIAKRRGAGVPPIAMGAGTMLAAACLLVPLVPAFPPAAIPSGAAVASTFVLALGSTAAAFVLYFRLIGSVGPVKTMTVNFITPLFGVSGGMLLLGEPFTWPLAAGGLLVLSGLALVLRDAPRAR